MPRAVRRLLPVAVFLICVTGAAAEVVERIVAVVDGDIVLLSDLKHEAVFFASADAGDEAGLLNRLIDNRLLLSEAKRFVPDGPTLPQVEKREAEVVLRFQNRDALRRVWQSFGLSEESFRSMVHERAWIDRLIEERVNALVAVPQKAIDAYRKGESTQAAATSSDLDDAAIRQILAERLAAEKRSSYLLRLRQSAVIEIY